MSYLLTYYLFTYGILIESIQNYLLAKFYINKQKIYRHLTGRKKGSREERRMERWRKRERSKMKRRKKGIRGRGWSGMEMKEGRGGRKRKREKSKM